MKITKLEAQLIQARRKVASLTWEKQYNGDFSATNVYRMSSRYDWATIYDVGDGEYSAILGSEESIVIDTDMDEGLTFSSLEEAKKWVENNI